MISLVYHTFPKALPLGWGMLPLRGGVSDVHPAQGVAIGLGYVATAWRGFCCTQGVAVGLRFAATAWRGFGRSSCPRRCHWVRICCHCVAGILLYPRRCRWVRVCCHCVAGVRTFILPKALPLGWGMLPLRGGVQTFILPKALPLG